MEPQNAYLIGYIIGAISVFIINYTWRQVSNVLKTDGLDHNFPKVWELSYTTMGRFSDVIKNLANKFIIDKGNIADFIRAVPFNTDGWHVATITIQFGLVKKKYKQNTSISENPYFHSIILTREDVPDSVSDRIKLY